MKFNNRFTEDHDYGAESAPFSRRWSKFITGNFTPKRRMIVLDYYNKKSWRSFCQCEGDMCGCQNEVRYEVIFAQDNQSVCIIRTARYTYE